MRINSFASFLLIAFSLFFSNFASAGCLKVGDLISGQFSHNRFEHPNGSWFYADILDLEVEKCFFLEDDKSNSETQSSIQLGLMSTSKNIEDFILFDSTICWYAKLF